MAKLPAHYQAYIGKNLFAGALEEIQALAEDDELSVNIQLASVQNVDVDPERLNVVHDGNGKIEAIKIG